MGLGRVELPTSRLSGVRSNHLSYRTGRRSRKVPGRETRVNRTTNVRVSQTVPGTEVAPHFSVFDGVPARRHALHRRNRAAGAAEDPRPGLASIGSFE